MFGRVSLCRITIKNWAAHQLIKLFPQNEATYSTHTHAAAPSPAVEDIFN